MSVAVFRWFPPSSLMSSPSGSGWPEAGLHFDPKPWPPYPDATEVVTLSGFACDNLVAAIAFLPSQGMDYMACLYGVLCVTR